ncbi:MULTISPECIES: CAP domain-containing protein [unclassified Sporosarcina]|uniref:CAP domain-containing protein n=1 Tax=unclassified Sporosarcina TaxID=2647733 RepID=UPI00204024F0|nr:MULTISPECIES: CAP domain-containing protein [unclassified Sporosarcina]GKV65791.1 hypothetical protein NCCP2331_19440 [Sporosarcina sp. NCCP-2331]GLB55915.1 hypothetical protein NCCP2378_17020 [Sporosarcina sp. NCCP-2378]
MKKPLSIILLSSAILLPTHATEASTINTVQTQAHTYKWKVENMETKDLYAYVWKTYNCYLNGELQKPQPETPSKPVEKPEQPSKPVEKPEQKPVEKPNKPVETPEQKPNVPTEKPQQPSTPPTDEQPQQQQPSVNANVSANEQAVLDLTNAERAKAGLKPLQIDAALQKSAKQKSADMAKNNYFSHTSPTYGSPFDQMKMNGITYRAAAENIAMGQRSAQEVVTGWMNSPGHRENILTPGFTHIGIGHDANGNYWTQQFIQK